METLKRGGSAMASLFMVVIVFIAFLLCIVAALSVVFIWLHLADTWFVRPYTPMEGLVAFGPMFLYVVLLGMAGARIGRRFRTSH